MPSRRRFLQTCCTLAGLGTLSGTASASTRTDALPTDVTDESSLLSEADPASLHALGDRTFGRLDFETLRSVRDAAAGRDADPGDDGFRRTLDARLAPAVGRDAAAHDAPARIPALAGSLDPTDVLSRVDARLSLDERPTVAGGDAGEISGPASLYAAGTDDDRAALGVDGDVLLADVAGRASTDGAGARALATGATDDLPDAATRVVEALGDADALTVTTFGDATAKRVDDDALTPVLAGLDALGLALDVDESTGVTTASARLVYGDAESADPAPVRALLETVRADANGAVDAVRVRDRGDALSVTARTPAASPLSAMLLLLLVLLAAVVGTFVLDVGSEEPRAPQVQFEFEYDASDGRVTTTHQGGDHVDALRVEYTHDGSRTSERWDDGGDGIQAGDSYTTQQSVDSGETVRLVWFDGDQSAVLASYVAP